MKVKKENEREKDEQCSTCSCGHVDTHCKRLWKKVRQRVSMSEKYIQKRRRKRWQKERQPGEGRCVEKVRHTRVKERENRKKGRERKRRTKRELEKRE